jgi:hypothetical protein
MIISVETYMALVNASIIMWPILVLALGCVYLIKRFKDGKG